MRAAAILLILMTLARAEAPMHASIDDWIARDAIPFTDDGIDRVIATMPDVRLLGFGEALHGGDQPNVADWISNGMGLLEANRELIEWIRQHNSKTGDPTKGVGGTPRANELRIEVEEIVVELRRRGPDCDGPRLAAALHDAAVARQLLAAHAAMARTAGYAAVLGIRDTIMADNLQRRGFETRCWFPPRRLRRPLWPGSCREREAGGTRPTSRGRATAPPTTTGWPSCRRRPINAGGRRWRPGMPRGLRTPRRGDRGRESHPSLPSGRDPRQSSPRRLAGSSTP